MTTRRTVRRARPTMREWFHNQTRAAKAAIGIIGALGAFVAGMAAIDARYANAGDVTQLRHSIERSQLANEIAIQNLRKSQLNDKAIELASKEAAQNGRLNPLERQALNRYRSELADITRDIDQKQRLLDRQRFGK